MTSFKPTHVFVARKRCGCCVKIFSVENSEKVNEQFLKTTNGLRVQIVDWETYKTKISQEPTFMNCTCPVFPKQVAREVLSQ